MSDPRHVVLDHVDTPIGRLALVTDDVGQLRAVGFIDGHTRMERQLHAYIGNPHVRVVPASKPGALTAALRAYFAGDLTAIDDLPVATGGTEFQRNVWRELRGIPCGETISYRELAQRIGNPAAVRAVGLANGANPIGVVVPCHRVIGSDGSLTGYGGGIERKRWLLAHERSRAPRR